MANIVLKNGNGIEVTYLDVSTILLKDVDGNDIEFIKEAKEYTISVSITNATASSSNPTTIKEGETATLTFTADGTSYMVPESMPTITGATGTYNRISDTECQITLSEPTSNVSFTVNGEVIKYTLSGSTDGTCFINGSTTYEERRITSGDSVTLTITCSSGYILPYATAEWVNSTWSLTNMKYSYTRSASNSATFTITPTGNSTFSLKGLVTHIVNVSTTNAALNIAYGGNPSLDVRTSSMKVNDCVRINSVSYDYSYNSYCRLLDSSGTIIKSNLSLPYYPTSDNYQVIAYSESSQNCIDYYTQVTMADGSTKNLGDIEVGDEVLSIDFDNMKLISRKVIYSGRDEPDYDDWYTDYYILNEFSDGKVIKQSMRHRMYNLENKAYVHLDDVWETGQHCYTLDGTNPTLVKRTYVAEKQRYARITLEGCNNYFANGLSTGDSECPTDITLDHKLEKE